MRLFNEVRYWEKFQGEVQIPYVAHDITNKREELRIIREHVLLVVRDYNQILDELASDERALFQEHIRRLTAACLLVSTSSRGHPKES